MNTVSYYQNKNKKYRMNSERKRRILKLVPKEAQVILDIGCGNGELASELKKGNGSRQITGIEISDKALSEEAKNVMDKIFCFDVGREDWPEELMEMKFDVIIISEVIEHLFYPDLPLLKCRDILNDGGSIIITTPNLLFWKNRLRMLFGGFRYKDKGIMDFGHIRFFTIDTIRELFDKCGLSIEKEVHFYPNLYKRGLEFVGRAFPGLFAYQFIFRLKSNERE